MLTTHGRCSKGGGRLLFCSTHRPLTSSFLTKNFFEGMKLPNRRHGELRALPLKCSKIIFGATAVFAWPDAEIAVMGPEAAVGILHRKRLAAAADHECDALKSHLVAEQTRIAGGVDRAMAIGVLDEVVLPHHTRRRLAEAFATAPEGRGHHGNILL